MVVTTGGTIDKRYDPRTGSMAFGESYVPEILERARVLGDISIKHLMAVDSLDMTDSQRQEIVDAVSNTTFERILITHGTDTAIKTGKAIKRRLAEDAHEQGYPSTKRVMLLGSMVPYTQPDSEALTVIGTGFYAVDHVEPGVYVAASGQCHEIDNVYKDYERLVFAPVQPDGIPPAELERQIL